MKPLKKRVSVPMLFEQFRLLERLESLTGINTPRRLETFLGSSGFWEACEKELSRELAEAADK